MVTGPISKCVDTDVMQARISQAAEAKTDPNFVLMARTDAAASEGLAAAIAPFKSIRRRGCGCDFCRGFNRP